MICLVSSATPQSTPEYEFKEFMKLHSRRFQVQIFLHCDAISFDSTLITKKFLEFIKNLGTCFEHEQTAAHDVSKSKMHRDIKLMSTIGLSQDANLRNGVVNGFLFWLNRIKKWPINNICNLLENWDENYHAKLDILMKEYVLIAVSENAPTEFTGVDVLQCRKATQLYRRYPLLLKLGIMRWNGYIPKINDIR